MANTPRHLLGIHPADCATCQTPAATQLDEIHLAAHPIVEAVVNAWAIPVVGWLSERLPGGRR